MKGNAVIIKIPAELPVGIFCLAVRLFLQGIHSERDLKPVFYTVLIRVCAHRVSTVFINLLEIGQAVTVSIAALWICPEFSFPSVRQAVTVKVFVGRKFFVGYPEKHTADDLSVRNRHICFLIRMSACAE